jgi:hypothetical protein
VSEGTGGPGRLRTWLYARLEEMSFRSGSVVAAAVLLLVAVAITLAVMPGGHRAVPQRTAGAASVPGSAVLSAPAAAPSPVRPVRSADDRAGSAAPGRDDVPDAAPGRDDVPDAAVGRTAAPQESSAPSPLWRPRPAEPAWLHGRWSSAGPPPAWMLTWPWDQRWPGPQWSWRDRDRRP